MFRKEVCCQCSEVTLEMILHYLIIASSTPGGNDLELTRVRTHRMYRVLVTWVYINVY